MNKQEPFIILTIDKDGRHSFDYDPLTGNIIRDQSILNKIRIRRNNGQILVCGMIN